jgi:hypothetical protein
MVKQPEPILYILARRAVGSSNAWIPGADLVEDLIPLRREDSNNFNPHGWFGKALTDVRGGKKGLSAAMSRWAPYVERSEKQPYRYRFLAEFYQFLTRCEFDARDSSSELAHDLTSEQRAERLIAPSAPSVASVAATVGFIYETHLQEYMERSWKDLSVKMGLGGFELEERDCGAVGTADIVAHSRETGEWAVIELKRTDVVDVAIGQITRYMSWLSEHRAGGAPVRGVLVGREFDEKTRYSARIIPGLTLWKYSISFNLEPDCRG